MKFRRFHIHNYRAIREAVVNLNDGLIPIIGINESGKSTLLQAILCFDKRKDGYISESTEGDHLECSNMYELSKNQAPCFVMAEVSFDNESEINSLCDKMQVTHSDQIKANLLAIFKNNRTLLLKRKISPEKSERTYEISGIDLPDETKNHFADLLSEYTPPIIYLNDRQLSDNIGTINFPQGYIGEDWRPGRSKYQAENRALLEELFYISSEERYSLKDFLQLSSDKDRSNLKRAVESLLNSVVISEWEKLKNLGIGVSDSSYSSNLQFEIDYQYNPEDDKKTFSFYIRLIDRSKSSAGKEFDLISRSKGFKWFLNFILKIKYNSDYLDHPSKALFLLDEPGSFLHSSAQEGLLEQLCQYSNSNPIIFCTHSQYFLNPRKINICSVKIVSRENGIITLKNFNEAGTSNYSGAWSPLYHALHLATSIHVFENSKLVLGVSNAIITEGVTDFYFFDMLKNYSDKIASSTLHFIPGTGAGQLRELISICLSTSDKFMIFLDSDDAGEAAYNKYKKEFGDSIAKYIWKYKSPSKESKFKLENFLSENDEHKLLSITNETSIKHGIITLYYMEDEVKRHFFAELDAVTIDNLSDAIKIIDSIFPV